eukprot:CAMPEP_0194537946 /NCGR_PEP_ID=MMETSP0253-20130528/77362_1 /TAXON_ID=2966 /ORGANISM="Noctiluca scintillans" /LENGTH=134 /DNA_ID=CAMNT_0039384009 /DNA_START=171 /DNA_END=576 /DNA_ORIENTATION=-
MATAEYTTRKASIIEAFVAGDSHWLIKLHTQPLIGQGLACSAAGCDVSNEVHGAEGQHLQKEGVDSVLELVRFTNGRQVLESIGGAWLCHQQGASLQIIWRALLSGEQFPDHGTGRTCTDVHNQAREDHTSKCA